MSKGSQKIVVIKIGSSTLVNSDGVLDASYLENLAIQVKQAKEAGWSPVIVSSGAIACGLGPLGFDERPSDMPTLQAAASVGQNILASAYADAFSKFDILTSMVLITRQTTAHRDSYLHARDTLNRLIELDVVPVINENDTISVEQIRFGDNDTLAALVSCLIKADLCILFSDIQGLYTANPNEDPNATLIPEVHAITPEIMGLAGGVGSSVGSGGMVTKIRAARILLIAGIEMIICHGREEEIFVRVLKGEALCTRFVPGSKIHDITPKKLWIALGDNTKGTITVDMGAKRALINQGSSLLAVGCKSTTGKYAYEDIVDIVDEEGHLFARGKAGASSSEISLACGRSQQEIKSNELFKDLAQRPVIHRDELVVFE